MALKFKVFIMDSWTICTEKQSSQPFQKLSNFPVYGKLLLFTDFAHVFTLLLINRSRHCGSAYPVYVQSNYLIL